MKKIASILLAACLAIGLPGNASAGQDRHDRRDHRPSHYTKHDHHHHKPRIDRQHRRGWIAPAAVLTLGGLAVGTTILHYPRTYPPAPAYAYGMPPPPSNQWYFCRSSGQYYPYTNACPEGWLAVSPR